MKITKHNYQTLELTHDERTAFEIVDEVLYQFQQTYFSEALINSQINGDCFQVDELSRVRGVLDFFETINQIFTVVEVE